VVATQIIGINPMSVPTIARTVERGIVDRDYDDIEILGQPIDAWIIKDFVVPNIGSIEFFTKMPKPIKAMIDSALRPKPVFIHRKCVGCGDCVEACPPRVIEMKDHKPYVNLNGCIRCFCCQELCPALAIEIKRPWLMNLLAK
jgi:ferredoxin